MKRPLAYRYGALIDTYTASKLAYIIYLRVLEARGVIVQ